MSPAPSYSANLRRNRTLGRKHSTGCTRNILSNGVPFLGTGSAGNPWAEDSPRSQPRFRHIGLSNIFPQQLAEAQAMTEIVCVQNFYNVAQRNDDAFIDDLAAQGIAYVPFFPLGGFTPLQSSALDAAAGSLKATPMQVALAWLLQRSPNIQQIPGTSSLAHLHENLHSSLLQIPPEVIADLDAIGTRPATSTSRRSAAVHRGTIAPARKDALSK
jgi:diketogulonate reductase-like aldo/keto reductase